MKNMIQAIIGMLLLIIFVSLSQTSGYAQSISPKKDSQLLKRIDFNNAYIMGQAIKSGAVYLLKRKNSEIKSMLKYRISYREEILEDFHVHDLNNKMHQDKCGDTMFSIDLNFSHDKQ
jgi:hypothetical protein